MMVMVVHGEFLFHGPCGAPMFARLANYGHHSIHQPSFGGQRRYSSIVVTVLSVPQYATPIALREGCVMRLPKRI